MKTLLCLLLISLRLSATPEDSILNWMAANHVPCAGVGIIEKGRIKSVRVLGELQKGHPAPVNTLFNIASQTKPVTAMLTLTLVRNGQWNLDEPLSHYWIDPDLANDSNLNKLTTRLVLSHQTGFPNWRNGQLRFDFPPGARFGYSGEGFEYLRHALEHKFHRPFNVLLDSLLFRPLGMFNTCYWSAQLDTTRFAMWHNGQGNPYNTSIQTPVNAADDLITTVEDYCRLGLYAMEMDSVFTPQVKVKDHYYRTLGWGMVTDLPNGEYALEHGGSDIGVRTMAVFLPRSGSGVVVMTNADNGMFVTDPVIKSVLPCGAQLLAIMNKGPQHERIHLPDSVIQRYTGVYVQNNGKQLYVEQADNAIKVSGDGIPTATLFPESAQRYFLEGYDVQLVFTDHQTVIIYEGGRQVMELQRK